MFSCWYYKKKGAFNRGRYRKINYFKDKYE